MGISTSTGTLTAGNSRTFNLSPASAVTLTLSPNVRVTITETPATVAATGLGGNASRVHEPRLPGVVTYGPYPMGGSVLVENESNSGSSVAWVRSDSIVAESADGSSSLVDGGGNPVAGFPISYTLATLPAAAAASGLTAFVSDVGAGIYVRSNGTRWLPINGRAVLYEVPATEPTSNTAAETTVVSVPLPIGLMANGDSMQVTARVSKSGSSDSHTFIARVSAGALTPLGTSTGWSGGQPATTNRVGMFMFNIKRVSATSVKPGASGAGYSATSTTAPAAVTVPNMDTQQTYLQLTSTITGGGGETVTWENARVEWVPAYA